MDRLFLSGCQISITAESLNIEAPSRFNAYALRRQHADEFAVSARKLKKNRAIISWPGCDRPYSIPICILRDHSAMTGPQPQRGTYLLGANYLRVNDFIKQKREEGKIVVITSMWDDICLHTNDLLRPERATIMPHQWTGFNYRYLWRDSRDDYNRLIDTLVRDLYIPEFQYRLRRPDGALGEYQTDYYYVRDYLNVPVRIGVSNVEDWRILEPAA